MIIYRNDADCCVGILYPMLDCPLPIQVIAAKDVPAGVPYRFVDDDFFHEQFENGVDRNDWVADFTKPDGYGSTEYGNGTKWEVVDAVENSKGVIEMQVRHVENGQIKSVKA
jgi:hypothetical protein